MKAGQQEDSGKSPSIKAMFAELDQAIPLSANGMCMIMEPSPVCNSLHSLLYASVGLHEVHILQTPGGFQEQHNNGLVV